MYGYAAGNAPPSGGAFSNGAGSAVVHPATAPPPPPSMAMFEPQQQHHYLPASTAPSSLHKPALVDPTPDPALGHLLNTMRRVGPKMALEGAAGAYCAGTLIATPLT